MDEATLKRHIADSMVHASALAGYAGAYSLGIGRDPTLGGFALVLMVAESGLQFPDHVQIEEEAVPLIVEIGFKSPRPLSSGHIVAPTPWGPREGRR